MGSSLQLFQRYKNDADIFIETGTFSGNGINNALMAGFKKIYSCDINFEYVKNANEKFKNQNVMIINKPSKEALQIFFNEINERCVIFLDGHFMPYDENDKKRGFGEDTIQDGLPPCPLLEELDIISNHHIKDHVILIDDFQCFGTWVFGEITIDQINEKIYTINQDYQPVIYGNTIIYSI